MIEQSWDRRGDARKALEAIVGDPQHGTAALSRPRVLTSLLKDLLPDAPREAGLLVAAADADLAGMLRESMEQGLDAATASRLASGRLAQFSAFTSDACDWVAGELAVALGYRLPCTGPHGTWQATQRAAGYDSPQACPPQPTQPGWHLPFPQNGVRHAADGPHRPEPPGASPPGAWAGAVGYPQAYQRRPPDPYRGRPAGAPPPQSIRRAARLMYAGAGLALVQAIAGMAVLVGARALARSSPEVRYARGLVFSYVLVALIAAVLWLWMAWASRRGRSWARILSAVLFALATLVLIASLVTPGNASGRLVFFVGWVIGLFAIIAQWQRTSSEYYSARRRPGSG